MIFNIFTILGVVILSCALFFGGEKKTKGILLGIYFIVASFVGKNLVTKAETQLKENIQYLEAHPKAQLICKSGSFLDFIFFGEEKYLVKDWVFSEDSHKEIIDNHSHKIFSVGECKPFISGRVRTPEREASGRGRKKGGDS